MSAQTPQRYDCMGDCRYDMVESTDGNYVRWGDYKLLRQWVTDLQSGMYVNCVYCGHRYGPGETTPVSMADALKEHVESCPQHPMSALKADRDRLRAEVERLRRQAAEWQPIETAPRGPACLFWVVPKSEEETWTDTSGWSITARGEPYIGMGPYGDWGSLWKATHWMRLPSAPTQASTDAPHCPTCGCGSEAPNTPAP